MLRCTDNCKILICILFLSTMLSLGGIERLQPITFIPHWFPQTQFAGYYFAKDLGIYKKYGLDVTILPGNPNTPSFELLRDKKADISTILLASAIREKAKGLDIVNIGQTSQMSSMLFVAKKSSGIRKPTDLNGRKIGIWRTDFNEIPMAFLEQYQIKPKEIIPISWNVDLFLEGGIDAMAVTWYNSYYRIINAGYNPKELVTFFFHDHNLNIPEDGIYCLKSNYQLNPQKYDKFVQATREGWAYAFKHPDEAVKITLKYTIASHNPANKAHQTWMLNRTRDTMMADGKLMYGLKENDYTKTCSILLKAGVIKKIPPYKSFVMGIADVSK